MRHHLARNIDTNALILGMIPLGRVYEIGPDLLTAVAPHINDGDEILFEGRVVITNGELIL